MAALFVLAGMAIKRKVDDKKKAKKLSSELRYEELQRETNNRLSRSQTETSQANVIDHSSDSEDEEGESPPPYQRTDSSTRVKRSSSNTAPTTSQTSGTARRASSGGVHLPSSYYATPYAARMG